MDTLHWGVLGFGAFADVAMGPAISNTPGHRLVAIMGRNRERVEAHARSYHVAHCFDSAEDLVRHPDLHAVYVATPNFQHCEHTIMAAEQGLHVICEKPMAVSDEEAGLMVDACRRNGVKLMIGNMMRFNPCHPWLRDQLKSGIIGEIAEARATFEFFLAPEYSQWRIDPEPGGAGVVMDVGVHSIDLTRYILDAEITEVAAFMETGSHPFPVDMHSAALLRFEGGALGTLFVSFNNKKPLNSLEFRGNKGVAVCEGTLWRESTGKVTILGEDGTRVFKPVPGTPNPYILQIEHFKRCIEQNRTPLISGEEGARDLKICLALYRSAKTGTVITLDR
jgi:predicted dehydrogenase